MKTALSVLIIEDDPDVRLGCERALELAGIPVTGCASAEEGLRRLTQDFAGIIVTDMRLPGADGMAVVRRAHELDPALPVIMITGHGDVTLAVEAMRSGAYDFIQKPFAPELLIEVVHRALDKRALALEVADLRRRLERREGLDAALIGRSPQMERLRQLILDVAGTTVDVLVRGETGTGKELVARCLHDLGPRPNPFNPATTLRFELPFAAPYRVRIHDLRGRLVWDSGHRQAQAGPNSVDWHGTSAAGTAVAGGMYVYRIEAAGMVAATGKLTLLP